MIPLSLNDTVSTAEIVEDKTR